MPFYRFHIDTPLSPDEAMARLRSLIHERKRSGLLEAFEDEMLRSKDDVKPFVGQIDGYSFRVRRDRWKPFAGHPRIRGTVIPAPGGARVKITLLPDPLLVFSFLPLAGAMVFGAFRGFAEGHANGAPPSPGVLLAFAAGACMWAVGISLDARELRDTIVTALRAGVRIANHGGHGCCRFHGWRKFIISSASAKSVESVSIRDSDARGNIVRITENTDPADSTDGARSSGRPFP